MAKPIVVLKNWTKNNYYTQSLTGVAFGHPDFRDGQVITTSSVIAVIKEADDTYIVETYNTMYVLVPPAPAGMFDDVEDYMGNAEYKEKECAE